MLSQDILAVERSTYINAASDNQFFSTGFTLPRGYKLPSGDTAWTTLSSARGLWVSDDLDKNGKPELIITDYSYTGRVHVFESAGNDSLQWVWSSPRLDLLGGYGPGGISTPRAVRTGDLDGDGKGEIVFPREGFGVLIFEWDGVVGSHKFGTKPSGIATTNVNPSGGIGMRFEQFEVTDIDNDAYDELIIPSNIAGTATDDVFILHAVGNWDFEEPGFSSIEIEWSTGFKLASLGGPSPYSVTTADLNGDGKREIVAHTWNMGNYFVIRVLGPDSYSLPSSYYHQTTPDDKVALFGGTVGDLDNDGNDEVYYAWYNLSLPASTGSISVVNYDKTDSLIVAGPGHTKFIASGQSTEYLMKPIIADLNNNGKKEIVTGWMYPYNIVAYEYQGGPIDDSLSYTKYIAYSGSIFGASSLEIRDSLGIKKDTIVKAGGEFMTKPFPPMDFDGDGRQEIITTLQGATDPISTILSHYTVEGSVIVDSGKLIPNPSPFMVRSLELNKKLEPVIHNVIFRADMNRLIKQGFDPINDSLQVSGSFNGWQTAVLLSPGEGNIFSGMVMINDIAGKTMEYKFHALPKGKFSHDGQEYGPNRKFTFGQMDQTLPLIDPFINVLGEITFPTPKIEFIRDVLDDNGKQVSVSWSVPVPPASNGVQKFGVWRKDDIWTFVGQSLVLDDTVYASIVPVIYDSTKTHGMFYSTFRISAHGTASELFSISAPDSGYSVDNRRPMVPSGLIASYAVINGTKAVMLWWNDVADNDLHFYQIYRDTIPNFTIGIGNILENVADSTFRDVTVNEKTRYYYKVIAVDYSGNISFPSTEISVMTTSVEVGREIPTSYSLSQNFPNPFNPSTTISYRVPEESDVTLIVYDALGRIARLILNARVQPGEYSQEWHAGDLASGMYIYRMTAIPRSGSNSTFTQVKKLMLMK